MKYKKPTKGKGIRKIFKKNGYEVYLVDEYNTSKLCSKCGGICETFKKTENPKPWKKGIMWLIHGLVKCKSCEQLWNRYENSSNNIYKISYNEINGLDRPDIFKRNYTET